MRLLDLDPRFLVVVEPGQRYREVDDIRIAQGVRFLCPACFAANGGEVGTHSILAWFRDRGVPNAEVPGPARWMVSGTSYADLTLSPSINIVHGCQWHGWVRDGMVSDA